MSDSHDTTLELLLPERRNVDPVPIVLLPQAPGSEAEIIARSLAQNLDEGRWRLLPAPDLGEDVRTMRNWHRDLWLAMPAADRDSVALVTGPTAGFLAPVLADVARTVVIVREPLAGVRLTTDSLPKTRALKRLVETPAEEVPPRLRRIANPQSRALLAPWHDPAEMTVSAGPPSDADRWREALFGDVLPHLEAAPVERAPRVARELAELLGGRPKPVVQAVKAATQNLVVGGEDPAHDELLLRFNWLDAELYDRCAGPGSDTG